MKFLKRLYLYYLEKWKVGPLDLLWIGLIFAVTGMGTLYLRRVMTPFLWGEYRGWGYYLTMPVVFAGVYYLILLGMGAAMGYREVFMPMVKRPFLLWQKFENWRRRKDSSR